MDKPSDSEILDRENNILFITALFITKLNMITKYFNKKIKYFKIQ